MTSLPLFLVVVVVVIVVVVVVGGAVVFVWLFSVFCFVLSDSPFSMISFVLFGKRRE